MLQPSWELFLPPFSRLDLFNIDSVTNNEIVYMTFIYFVIACVTWLNRSLPLFCDIQGFTENLHAVFCLAENAVGPEATRPDDIITMYSGR